MMTEPEEVDSLVNKFQKLTVEMSSKEPGRARADSELKSLLKEITKLDLASNSELAQKIAPIIKLITNPPSPESHASDMEMSNIIGYLKALSETPLLKPHSKGSENEAQKVRKDPFWTEVILPNLTGIYRFFHSVLTYCAKTLSDTVNKSSSECASSTGGFAHHQLLGLLQKGMRTFLIFLKRGILNPETFNCSDVMESLEEIVKVLHQLMVHSVDIGLDVRCNIGLSLAYTVFHKFKGDKAAILNLFEQIFLDRETNPNGTASEGDELLKVILDLPGKDINRIGMAVGVIGSWDFEDLSVDYSKLMYLLGKNILNVDHGTKETTNLGSARTLELWTETLSRPFIPLKTLEITRPLFPSLEFFVFSYIPGHIDAVKNCCRNLLGFLTQIYDRLDSINNGGLVEGLLRKIFSKPSHVKWIGLACITKNSPASTVVLKFEKNLPEDLLCTQRTSKIPASESYISLMSYEFSTTSKSDWEKRWIKPLFVTQPRQEKESNWPQKRTIITTILKSEKGFSHLQVLIAPILDFVIRQMNENSLPISTGEKVVEESEGFTESTLLAVGTIKIASELGLKVELASNCSAENSFRGLVPKSVFHSWLWSQNPQIRLTGFSLICETRRTSEVISKDDFESLKIVFTYSLVSQNPAFRQQFVAYFKKLFRRLQESHARLKRKKDTENLENYDDFCRWLWTFLTIEDGLFVGANFARRCQALECLSEMVGYFEDVSIFGVKSEDSNMQYLRWLTDSYETNKARALTVLEKVPLPSFENDATCEAVFSEAMTLCESLRPPDSVTGRFLMVLLMKKSLALGKDTYSAWNILQTLLQKLEEIYERIIKTNLTDVSCRTPMYGFIKCIHMILQNTDDYLVNSEKYRDFSAKLIDVFLKLDEVLFPILGNAAPEGFLPQLPESSEDNTQVVRSIAAQMLLVCSWRSMKDITILLSDLAVLFPLEGENMNMRRNPDSPMDNNTRLKLTSSHILTVEQILTIGDHLLYLLKNLMHRGVFEQAFVGFKVFATRLWTSANPELNSLPEKWLKEAMDEEHMNSKCITRRSGGLPYIFQALLSAEKDNEAFLSKWVQRLFIKDESFENTSLRIHAMNVLRGLIRDTNFSSAMMPFVPDGLRIAFRGLKAQNWNERNAGLMLYGAVMKRTFGPRLNFMSAPTFFRKFPQMYTFLLGELDTCLLRQRNQDFMKPNVPENAGDTNRNPFDFTFHLLLLLSAFAPIGIVEDDHFRLGEFISRLQKCAASPDMEVRKLAAKAIVPFLINPDDKRQFVMNLLKCLQANGTGPALSLNLIHGYILQIEAVALQISDEPTMEVIIPTLADVLSSGGFWKIKCPLIYQALAQTLLTINQFRNPHIVKICNNLDTAYEMYFDSRVIAYRNFVPGLPVADEYVSKLKIVCNLSSFNSKCEPRKVIIYDWLSKREVNVIFVEQLLHYLCNTPALVESVFNSQENEIESVVLLESVVKRYLYEDIKYAGQSVLESQYLQLLAMVSHWTYNSWVKSTETDPLLVSSLLERLMTLCAGTSATTENKAASFRVVAILLFRTDVAVSKSQQDFLCQTLVEWSFSTADDDLRYAAALSIPEIPFQKLEKFSVINRCKMWLAIILLTQDDEPPVRSIISAKFSKPEKPGSDRKSLERLIEVYFKEVVEPLPLEGLTLLIGILFRDDYEIKMEDAEDEEEARLFERSELNMFYEPVVFAKAVHRYMKTLSPKKSYKEYFNKALSPELVELYELASNSNLFFCTSTLELIIEILKKKEDLDDDSVNPKQEICIPITSEKHAVQKFICEIVDEDFLR